MSEIKTLYTDKALTEALYPRTKFNAVSDDNGNVLGNVASLQYTKVMSGVDDIEIKSGYWAIDTSKLLAHLVGSTNTTYVASENCFIVGTLWIFMAGNLPSLNGVPLFAQGGINLTYEPFSMYLSKGDALEMCSQSNAPYNIKVFGLKEVK